MVSFKIENLSFAYPENKNKALSNINLNIKKGEFIVICGKSGCGKTTLLRHLKPAITPHGEKLGEILFENKNLNELDLQEQAQKIGFVMQNPDNQIVTDKVCHELAFGLENLGVDTKSIRLRVAEMASFFGISDLFNLETNQLSGGQKQVVNLASVMAMQPSVLILDEPSSQLDPIAATEFLNLLKKVNTQLGTTIIMTEHRLEEVFPMADNVIVMDGGRIFAQGTPTDVGYALKVTNSELFNFMPSVLQLATKINTKMNLESGDLPLTVKDGRKFLSNVFDCEKSDKIIHQRDDEVKDPVISFDDVWFRYEKNAKDILKGMNFDIEKASIHAVLGSNGAGKSTAISLICKIATPYRGKILIDGKNIKKYSDKQLFDQFIGCLPQNPQVLFVKETVLQDLQEMFENTKISSEEIQSRINNVVKITGINHLLNRHSFDLSGGEQQKCALAKVLLNQPEILLLDEPTKGFDNCYKENFAEILTALKQSGVTVLMVSHDIEFCAKYADKCSLIFDGDIITTNKTRRFFAGNSFYTTSANRMTRHLFDDCITNEDIIGKWNELQTRLSTTKIE